MKRGWFIETTHRSGPVLRAEVRSTNHLVLGGIGGDNRSAAQVKINETVMTEDDWNRYVDAVNEALNEALATEENKPGE